MGADGLRRYLNASGHEDPLDDAEVDRLLDQIRLQQPGRARLPRLGRPLLALDDFHRYLFLPRPQPAHPPPAGAPRHVPPAITLLHLHGPQLLPHRQPAQQRLQRRPHHQGAAERGQGHRAGHVAKFSQGRHQHPTRQVCSAILIQNDRSFDFFDPPQFEHYLIQKIVYTTLLLFIYIYLTITLLHLAASLMLTMIM